MRRDKILGLEKGRESIIKSASHKKHTNWKKQANTSAGKNTLAHGETLLVVSTSDLEDVPSEIFTDHFTGDFVRNPLVIDLLKNSFVINFNRFLTTSVGERNVKLHDISVVETLNES
eukprot:TRINITY_DN1780_c0_g1_i4.p1 TRINITY_DN1780_c0_g1~~TRINITY_DN1780_c0_g1_i4.p1  ORF type:complete len:117 (-),score=12.31 TRINITY_DN1780_c0_g1_i4:93-443(-)